MHTLTFANDSLGPRTIAYDHIKGASPCVIFCAGFNSNRQGNKALALQAFCIEQGLEFIRFDYTAHGDSGGDFAECSIATWLEDTLAIIDKVAESSQLVLVGSSMGGWLALCASMARQQKVVGLLLIACAADMTKYYPQRLAGLSIQKDEQGREYYAVPNEYDDQQPYRVYQHLIDHSAVHYVLDQDIELTIPVRLVHGVDDDVVPWQRSVQVLEKLCSNDATLQLIQRGDHRLSTEQNLAVIKQSLITLVSLAR